MSGGAGRPPAEAGSPGQRKVLRGATYARGMADSNRTRPARGARRRAAASVLVPALASALACPGVIGPAPARAEGDLAAAVRRAGERRAAGERARDGWHRVGGRWVRPAAAMGWGDLLSVRIEPGGSAAGGLAGGASVLASAVFSPAVEALVADGRASLVEIGGEPFTVDARGRGWDAGRVGPTQVLTVRRASTGAGAVAVDATRQLADRVGLGRAPTNERGRGAGGAASRVSVLGVAVQPDVTTVDAVVVPADAPTVGGGAVPTGFAVCRVTVRVTRAGVSATVAPVPIDHAAFARAGAAALPDGVAPDGVAPEGGPGLAGVGGPVPLSLSLAGADAVDLLARHPADARRFVAPVLAALNGGADPLAPRPGDLYRAFPPGAGADADPVGGTVAGASPADRGAVGSLVAGLSDPDPAARRSAAEALAGLGPAGVRGAVAVLADPSVRLAPDARVRLAALVAADRLYPLGPGGPTDGSALRADVHFLLDALSAGDPAVRRAAAGALAGRLGASADDVLALTPAGVLAWHERLGVARGAGSSGGGGGD